MRWYRCLTARSVITVYFTASLFEWLVPCASSSDLYILNRGKNIEAKKTTERKSIAPKFAGRVSAAARQNNNIKAR